MRARPEIMDIVKRVATASGLTVSNILSASRLSPEAAGCRHICFWISCEIYGYTQFEVARAFDRNRSTVSLGVQAVQKKISEDEQFEEWVDEIVDAVTRKTVEKVGTSSIAEDKIEKITTLRARGMSVDSIVKCTGYDETLVARVCGVSWWKGRSTYTIGKDIQS